jgi:hypothetical protein
VLPEVTPLEADLSYPEHPIKILDQKDHVTRHKVPILNFWSKISCPFWIFKVEPVLDKLEKLKTVWGPLVLNFWSKIRCLMVWIETPRPRWASSDNGRRCLAYAHGFTRYFRPSFLPIEPPPSTASGGYKASTLPQSTPFSSSSTTSPLLCRSEHRHARHHWAAIDNPL